MLWMLLQGLGADSIEERERAAREMIERRDEAAARRALTSSDLETRARAADVLDAILWASLERAIPAFLADQELPSDDVQPLRTPFDLRGARIFRTGRGWNRRLLSLRLDRGIRLSEPFSEGMQDFVVDLLRDRRARSDEERVAVAKDCVALMDLFDIEGWTAPGACLPSWPPMASEGTVFWGGMTHRNPGFRADFGTDGRLLSADFWYRD
ncbi:MAG TPA: hypothetical protein VF950_20870 [Planctomycetota bacterium]